MNKFIKKIVAVATVFTVLSFVGGSAFALTAEELQVSINSLLTQLAGLQAQLAALGGGTGTITCVTPSFINNLSQGQTGEEIRCLQKVLNSDSATKVADSGAGSPGYETTYFGPLTFAGVVKFQNKYAAEILTPLGLTAGTGFVGAATRAKLNTLLSGLVTPVTPPTGCTSDAQCGAAYMCSAAVCVLRPTGGKEGSITALISATPASGITTYAGSNDVAVVAADVKATGSDIVVNRVDLNFTSRPWLYVTKISVYDGATLAGSTDVTQSNTTEVTVGSSYYVRVEGLNILIPVGTAKTITAKVNVIMAAGDTTQDMVINFPMNAFRGTDGAGIAQYTPAAAAGLATRTFTVTTGDAGVVELSTATTNPIERAELVGETATTENIPLLAINLKAKYNGVVVRTLGFDTFESSSLANIISTYKLYDGTTAIASTSSVAAGTPGAIFENLTLSIPKDTTKTIWLKADVLKTTDHFSEGESASATMALASTSAGNNRGIYAEDATTFAQSAITGSAATGKTAYFYVKAPSLVLGATSITPVTGTSGSSTPQEASAQIAFSVTAKGADIFMRLASSTAASSGIVAQTDAGAASTTLTQVFSSNAEEGTYTWKVPIDTTKTFTVQGSLVDTGQFVAVGTDYFDRMSILDIKWALSDSNVETDYTTWTWGFTDFRTPQILLKARQ